MNQPSDAPYAPADEFPRKGSRLPLFKREPDNFWYVGILVVYLSCPAMFLLNFLLEFLDLPVGRPMASVILVLSLLFLPAWSLRLAYFYGEGSFLKILLLWLLYVASAAFMYLLVLPLLLAVIM